MATTIAPLNQMIKKRKLMQRRRRSLSLSPSFPLFGRDLFERQKARNRFAKIESDDHDDDDGDMAADGCQCQVIRRQKR